MLLALLLGGLLAGARALPFPTAKERLPPTRPSVAMIGFANQSGQPDLAWLSRALPNALEIELRTGSPFLQFSTGPVSVAKAALSLEDTDGVSPEQARRLGALLGCRFVVTGAYSVMAPPATSRLRLELRVQDTSTGETIARVEENGPLQDPLSVISRAGEGLRQALGVWGMPSLSLLQNALPSSVEALRLYYEGMARLHQQDGSAAQALFERVIALEPIPAGPHSARAFSLIAKGDRSGGRQEMAKMLSRPEQGTHVDRLNLEALYVGYAPDWRRAAELYQQVFDTCPDNYEFALALTSAQVSAGNPEAALATLTRVRERPPPPVFAAMLDEQEAKAARRASDFRRAQAAAARAASQSEALKNWFSAGTNRILEADALAQLDEKGRAREAVGSAIKLFQRAGNRLAEAEAIRRLTEMLPPEDLRGGLQIAREALALFSELGSASGRCMTLLDIAGYQHALGELRGALRSAKEAFPLCHGTRLPSLELAARSIAGRVHQSLGNLDAAESELRERLRLARERENTEQTALGLMELGDLLLIRGDLVQARALYDEVQGLRREPGQRAPEDLDLRSARLAFEEGRLDEAARLAEAAVTTVSPRSVSAAHLLRARIFLVQARLKEANAELLVAGDPPMLLTRLMLRLERARLSAARGGAPERKAALKSLGEVLAEAQRLEWREGQHEALLALGELELASGSTAAGALPGRPSLKKRRAAPREAGTRRPACPPLRTGALRPAAAGP